MRMWLNQTVGVLAGVLLAVPAAADTLTLGEKDFDDGIRTFLFDYQAVQAGEETPDFTPSFIGDDREEGEVFDSTFTFRLGYGGEAVAQGEAPPPNGDVTNATLTIGLFDHDSAADGSQVDSFSMNGQVLTSILDGALESHGGSQDAFEGSEYNVYTIDLPSFSLSDLTSGLSFHLVLSPDSLIALPGEDLKAGPGNGASIDYAMLFYEIGNVPEPSTALLLAMSAIGVAALRRR